jgi:hypothetical protein
LGSGRSLSSLSESILITGWVLAKAAGAAFLDAIFMPGTTVEIIVVVVVPVFSTMVVMEVGPVVVMVVTNVDISAVDGTAVGTTLSVVVVVSGVGMVVFFGVVSA